MPGAFKLDPLQPFKPITLIPATNYSDVQFVALPAIANPATNNNRPSGRPPGPSLPPGPSRPPRPGTSTTTSPHGPPAPVGLPAPLTYGRLTFPLTILFLFAHITDTEEVGRIWQRERSRVAICKGNIFTFPESRLPRELI